MTKSVLLTFVCDRPVPESLVHHGSQVLASAAASGTTVADVVSTPTRGAHWFGIALRAPGPNGANVDAARQEIYAAARGLGVDVALVEGPLADSGPALIITDADSTLLDGETINDLAARAGRGSEVTAITEMSMAGKLEFAESLRRRTAALEGLEVKFLQEVATEIPLMPGARELISTLAGTDATLGVVSGGFVEVLRPLLEPYGVQRIAANTLGVEDGRLTGKTVGPVIDRPAKAYWLRNWVEELGVHGRVVAVGDGANDLDMIADADLGVAFCATPVVIENSDVAVTVKSLDAVLGLLGQSTVEVAGP